MLKKELIEKVKQLEAINVELNDNIVTKNELAVLKVYKFIALFSVGYWIAKAIQYFL